MEVIQEHEGLDPDGRRTYAECSLDPGELVCSAPWRRPGNRRLAIVARRLVVGVGGSGGDRGQGWSRRTCFSHLDPPSVDVDHPWLTAYVPTAIPGLPAVRWRRHRGGGCVAGWPKTVGRLVAAGPGHWMRGPAARRQLAAPGRDCKPGGGRRGQWLCAQFLPWGLVAVLAADERLVSYRAAGGRHALRGREAVARPGSTPSVCRPPRLLLRWRTRSLGCLDPGRGEVVDPPGRS